MEYLKTINQANGDQVFEIICGSVVWYVEVCSDLISVYSKPAFGELKILGFPQTHKKIDYPIESVNSIVLYVEAIFPFRSPGVISGYRSTLYFNYAQKSRPLKILQFGIGQRRDSIRKTHAFLIGERVANSIATRHDIEYIFSPSVDSKGLKGKSYETLIMILLIWLIILTLNLTRLF